MDMGGAMVVVMVMMVAMMGGMAWGVVAVVPSRIRGKRDKRPD
jgi:hypothetical protein